MDIATIAFKQQFRPGKRYTEGDRINSSILRAMKKGKLSKDAARNCMHAWPAMRAARAKAVVWHTVAIAELARVARVRRTGQYSLAKVIAGTVRGMLTKVPAL